MAEMLLPPLIPLVIYSAKEQSGCVARPCSHATGLSGETTDSRGVHPCGRSGPAVLSRASRLAV